MDTKAIGTLITIALVGGAIYFWSSQANQPSIVTTPTPATGASTPADVKPRDTVELPDVRDFNQLQETAALARGLYLDLSNQGTAVTNRLGELKNMREKWNKDINDLLTNETGRYVVADLSDVTAFRAHYKNAPAISEEQIAGFQNTLDTLLEPINHALKTQSVTGTPNPEFVPRLKSLDAQIEEALVTFRESVPAIEALVTAAEARGAKGSQTLAKALEELDQADAITRGARIEAARKKADEEVTEQLAKAAADLALADGEAKRLALVDEAARVVGQMEADTLKAKATHPDTLKRLEPFVTKGNTILLPNDRMYEWRRNETEPLPLSFKSITLQGALEPTERGLKNLMRIVMDYNNGRPAWPQPSSKEDWDRIRENQKLLKDLGPTLVSLGHLAP